MIKHRSNADELENLRANIVRKMSQLDVKLPEFAKIVGIKYMLLRRIMYDTENQLYFQTSLKPIADYFNVEISDLLSCPHVPQYVPLIGLNEAESFIKHPAQFVNHERMILSEKFVHTNAFAINIENENNNCPYKIATFIIKPEDKIIIGYYSIFKNKDDIIFGKLESISNNQLMIRNVENNNVFEIPGSSANVIGNAVRIIVDEDMQSGALT